MGWWLMGGRTRGLCRAADLQLSGDGHGASRTVVGRQLHALLSSLYPVLHSQSGRVARRLYIEQLCVELIVLFERSVFRTRGFRSYLLRDWTDVHSSLAGRQAHRAWRH
jgi:hypothetical protein